MIYLRNKLFFFYSGRRLVAMVGRSGLLALRMREPAEPKHPKEGKEEKIERRRRRRRIRKYAFK